MHRFVGPHTARLGFAAALAAFGLTACFMDVKDSDSGHGSGTQIDTPSDTMPAGLTGVAQACPASAQAAAGPQSCYSSNDYTWRTSCRSDACESVKVYVHYMLTQSLGDGLAAHVEAFDNPDFQGSPVATTRLANFSGQTGQWREADMYLAPGEYYLRAYLTNQDDEATPYQLGDMQLVGGQPVGIYGALSGAQSVVVAPASQGGVNGPVDIFLDKLFTKPGSAPDTNAHIRIEFSVDPTQVVDGRAVRIELRKSADLTEAPVYAYSMASELLLIQGRAGKAEFITPSIDPANYIVFAYLDDNGNSYYDDTELSAIYKQDGQPFALAVQTDHTVAINLTLAAAGAQPPPTPAPTPSSPAPAPTSPTPAPAPTPAPTPAPAPSH